MGDWRAEFEEWLVEETGMDPDCLSDGCIEHLAFKAGLVAGMERAAVLSDEAAVMWEKAEPNRHLSSPLVRQLDLAVVGMVHIITRDIRRQKDAINA